MNVPKENPNPTIFLTAICGYVAMWATRQSPYFAPDGLTEVLKQFQANVLLRGYKKFSQFVDVPCTRKELNHILKCDLLTIPQVLKWNERKNGNPSPHVFCSRYDRPNPDDDVIDLDALTGNVIRSCLQDAKESWREHYESQRWTLRKWWYNFRLRFRIGMLVPQSTKNGLCQK